MVFIAAEIVVGSIKSIVARDRLSPYISSQTCTALHCTALLCAALYFNALHCTALHCTALHCTAMLCTALHFTPYRSALHCTALTRIEEHQALLFGHGLGRAEIAQIRDCKVIYYNTVELTAVQCLHCRSAAQKTSPEGICTQP